MKIKRMIAILLALMMVGSLAACGDPGQDQTAEDPAQTGDTESAEQETGEQEETEPEEPTVEQVLDTYY